MKACDFLYQQKVVISFILLLPIATLHSLHLSLDSQNYREAFEFYNETSWNLFFNQLKEIELFHLLIAKIYPQDQLLYIFSLIAGLSILLKIMLINKTSQNYYASIIFYLTYYFPIHEGTQIRVSLAIGIAYWGIFYWTKNKKRIGFILVLFSGLFFHYSILTLLPAFTILSKNRSKYIIISWILLVVLYFLNIKLLTIIKNILDILSIYNIEYEKLSTYLSRIDPNSKPYSIQILILLSSTLFVYFIKKKELNEFQHACFNLLLFSFCILVLLSGESVLQNRISQIYRFSIIFIIPLYLSTLQEHLPKKWQANIIFTVTLLIYYFIYNSKLTDIGAMSRLIS